MEFGFDPDIEGLRQGATYTAPSNGDVKKGLLPHSDLTTLPFYRLRKPNCKG